MFPQGEAERAAAPNEDTHTVAPLDVRTKAPHELLLLPIVQSASLSLRPVATLHEEVVADGALARRMPPHGETVALVPTSRTHSDDVAFPPTSEHAPGTGVEHLDLLATLHVAEARTGLPASIADIGLDVAF